MTDQEQSRNNPDDFIDLRAIFVNYIRQTLKRWYIPLLLILIVSAVLLVVKKKSFNTSYNETVYYSVTKANGLSLDAMVASRIASGMEKITGIDEFKKQIRSELQEEELPCSYSIVAVPTESANLFSVTVICDDEEYTSRILDAFIKIYPSWANIVVGNCILTVTDRSELTGDVYSSWSTKKVLMFGFGGGIALWCMIATVILLCNDKIYGQNEMDRLTDTPCLGMLPKVRKKRKKNSDGEALFLFKEDIDRNYLKAFRLLRMKIERLIEQKSGRVYMIVSAYPKEGTSLCILNLAMELQRHGSRVAVIDADMRGHGISSMVETEEEQAGLSDFMHSSEASVENYRIRYRNLSVITAGRQKEDFAGLLDRDRMSQLLISLKSEADIILLDTPPADYFGDALVTSEFVDGVFCLVRTDYAEKKEIRRIMEIFEQKNLLEGYILNGVQKPIFGEVDYRYYSYEYSKKPKTKQG